jgi:hypothetical protein
MKRFFCVILTIILPLAAICGQGYYSTRKIEGWNVTINRELLKKGNQEGVEARALLKTKLAEIKRLIPAEHHAFLTSVSIWMEIPELGAAKCAVYHPSPKWLSDHGHNPAKARSVEIANPELFINWSPGQPFMVLHELAHAYHHQVLTHKFEPITNAYVHACENGLYEEVKYLNGKTKRAYALNDQQEYFAELTEAYFGTNDYFPFTRRELEEYDPVGLAAVKKAWKISD